MTTDKQADAASQPGEVALERPVRLDPERAAFDRWCGDNGHGTLDDMLAPLDRSLRALMWSVWEAATSAERVRPLECGEPLRIVAGHPAVWVNVRALRDALDHSNERSVMPFAYAEQKSSDDVCMLLRLGA